MKSNLWRRCLRVIVLVGIVCLMMAPQSFAEQVNMQQSIPVIQTWKNSNGIDVYFIQRSSSPMLDVAITFDAGSKRDGKQFGLGELTGQLLSQGTKQLSADQVAENLDIHGAQYGVTTSRDMTVIQLRTLTDPDLLSNSIGLMHSLIVSPAFRQVDVDHKKQQQISWLKYDSQNPSKVSINNFYRELYVQHPYAHNPLGNEQTVSLLNKDDIGKFYNQYYVGSNAKIILVGDVSIDQAKKISNDVLAGLSSGERATKIADPVPRANKVNTTIDYPSSQAAIAIGQLGITRRSPEYFSFMVGNHLLGGLPLSSILFDEVRNKNGLAYSVGSMFVPLQQKGPFVILLQTKLDQSNKATEITLKTLEDFTKKNITKKELNLVKNNMKGQFYIALSSSNSLVDIASYIAFYNRKIDYLQTYTQHIDAVTGEDINKSFAGLINPNKMVLVSVKPKDVHDK
jgi:zinc protease